MTLKHTNTQYYFERKAQFEQEKAKAIEWRNQKYAEMRAKYVKENKNNEDLLHE